MKFNLRLASIEDEEPLRKLINESQLSEKGIKDDNSFYLIAEDLNNEKRKILAIAGIEKRAKYGYLKSLVLEAKFFSGISSLEFITSVVSFAKKLKLEDLYLLTLPNSKTIFELLNFQIISLEELPEEIKKSKHFTDSYKENVIIMKSY